MGRNCISRFVSATPVVKGFRPFGRFRGIRDKVFLSLDEYEAIRLLDYEDLNQEEAAVKMQVSRPTLTRIYERARKKYAKALIEGSMLLIEGGDITLRQHMYLCEACGAYLETEQDSLGICPQCQSTQLISLEECYKRQCGACHRCGPRRRNRA